MLFVKLRPASSSDTHFQTFALDQEKDLMVSVSVCVCVCVDPRLPDVMDIATPANQADAAIER